MAELVEYRDAAPNIIIREVLWPLVDKQPHDWQAFITMLHPGLYSSDLEAHRAVREEPDLAEFAVPEVMTTSLGPLQTRSIPVKWLRILPDVGMHEHTADDIYTEIITLLGHQEVGDATVRFAFFKHCWTSLLEAVLDAEDTRVYLCGAAVDIPKRSFQAYFQAGRLALLRLSEYSDNVSGHASLTSRVLLPPYSINRECYVRFWLSLFNDSKRSLSLEEAYSLSPNDYPHSLA